MKLRVYTVNPNQYTLGEPAFADSGGCKKVKVRGVASRRASQKHPGSGAGRLLPVRLKLTRYRSDISSAFPPRSSLPLKTPSCGMFLASLSAPPSTRFVCNPAEFALVSEKGFRHSSMSETTCCCLCFYGFPINNSAIFLVRIEIILIFAKENAKNDFLNKKQYAYKIRNKDI